MISPMIKNPKIMMNKLNPNYLMKKQSIVTTKEDIINVDIINIDLIMDIDIDVIITSAIIINVIIINVIIIIVIIINVEQKILMHLRKLDNSLKNGMN